MSLPGLTPSLTHCLKELQERLQSRTTESPVSVAEPSTWKKQPVRVEFFSNYKKLVNGRYQRPHKEDWTSARRGKRAAINEAAWLDYLKKEPRTPEGAAHLIIGDSLVRFLTRVGRHWKIGVLRFSGAATPQMLASPEILEVRKIHTVTMMMGRNYISRGDFRKMTQWPEKVSCLLQEARIYLDPTVLTTCTVPYNMMLDGNGLSMNGRVRHINGIILEIQGSGALPLKLLQGARMIEDLLPAGCSSYSIKFDQP